MLNHPLSNSMRLIAAISIVCLVCAFMPPSVSFAESPTSGSLIGYVYNSQRKVVQGATITVVNEETDAMRAVKTNKQGAYCFPDLPPGVYNIKAQKDGYVNSISRFPISIARKNLVTQWNITLSGATVNGKIVDRNGSNLVNASVTVATQDGVISRRAATNHFGNFSINDIPTGSYIITAEWRGEASYGIASIPIVLDKRNVYAPDIELGGAVSEASSPQQARPAAPATEGDRAASLVQAIDPARASNLTELQIRSLPIGGASYMRSFDEFALLAAGVAPPPYTPGVKGPGVGFGIGTAGQFSVNGMRPRSNNFSVDGSDNNDPDLGVRRQGFVALVSQPIESIKDFSISTLLWDAELGRNSGSQVNVVSNYGSNEFHLEAYTFFTDSSLNARNFFDYTGGPSGGKDRFTRGQAGLVFGGPIIRKRTQFFGSFEYDRVSASTEQHFSTPMLEERSLFRSPSPDFGALVEGSVQVFRGASPLGRNILSLYPLPNDVSGPFGPNTFTQILPADGKGYVASFKVAHQVSPDHSLHARYNFTDDRRVLPSISRAINSTLDARTQSQNLSLILYSKLGERLFSEARFSFGRTRLRSLEYPGSPFVFSASSQETLLIDRRRVTRTSETGPIGQLIIEPFSPVGVDAFTFPQSRASNTFQYADSISWTPGTHSVKFGANVRRYQLNSMMDRLYRPLITYSGGQEGSVGGVQTQDPTAPPFEVLSEGSFISGVRLASLGIPSLILQSITAGPPDSNVGLRFTEYHLFINDNWRIRRGLTFDFGLRYEYNTVPREVNDRIEDALRLKGLPSPGLSRFDTPTRTEKFNSAVDAYRRILDGRNSIYAPDHNNFGPHVGFAWTPGASDKTAIRGGFGIYHDTILGAVVSQSRNVFPNEIPISVDPSFLEFDTLRLVNPAFLRIALDAKGNPTSPVSVLKPGSNQFGGAPEDFVAVIGQLFTQNLGGGLAFTLTDKNLRSAYARQWHLTIERELFGEYVLSAAYVGTKGARLLRLLTPNGGLNVMPFLPMASSLNGISFDFPLIFNPLLGASLVPRPEENLGPYQIYDDSANSVYHAFQLEARKRYDHGYTFTASYTWSHAIDDVSDVFPIAGAPILPDDQRNLGFERADANFDIRHRFAASVVWDLPFYRGANSGIGRLLSGWQVAAIVQAHTGQPFTLNLPIDENFDGNLSDRPLYRKDGFIFFNSHGPRRVALAPGLEFNSFSSPDSVFPTFPVKDPAGIIIGPIISVPYEPMGRNVVRADSFINWDFAVNKTFRLRENHYFEFRAEFFNLLNRANFGIPVRVLDAPGFGSAIDTVNPARRIQFAVKYRF